MISYGNRNYHATRGGLKRAARMACAFIFGAILTLGLTVRVSAETVPQKFAKTYAQQFFDTYYKQSTAPVKFVYNGKRLTTDRLLTPFYVYNSPRGGFVIISAENKVMPVLAYSLTESFNPEKLTDGETALLRNYATDIEYVKFHSEVPVKAIEAWGDMNGYIRRILASSYTPTEPTITPESAAETLDMLWTTDAGLNSYADLYTTGQWQDMVDNELSVHGSAALGFIDSKGLHPAVVYGRKGDYYRMELNGRNSWFARLMAGELSVDRQLLSTLNPSYVAPEPAEEPPFAFYDGFVASLEEEALQRENERILAEQEPVIKLRGRGRFDIYFPEDITLAMLYNLNGSHIGRRTYKGTNVAHIDIESEQDGFYFALIYGASGRPYGLKLYR